MADDTRPEPHAWSVRVGASPENRAATVFVRKRQYAVGAPIHFDSDYQEVTALEHVLGALGADIVNGLRAIARKRRVEVEHVEAVVRATLNNPLVYLGVVGETGHPGIETVTVKVYVSSLADRETLEAVWDETIRSSPLCQTFAPLVELTLDLKPVL